MYRPVAARGIDRPSHDAGARRPFAVADGYLRQLRANSQYADGGVLPNDASVGPGMNVVLTPWYTLLDFGLWCIPIVLAFIFFAIGLEIVDTAVEEPFGTELDDLPLERYCRTIRDSMDEIFAPQPDSAASATLNQPVDIKLSPLNSDTAAGEPGIAGREGLPAFAAVPTVLLPAAWSCSTDRRLAAGLSPNRRRLVGDQVPLC